MKEQSSGPLGIAWDGWTIVLLLGLLAVVVLFSPWPYIALPLLLLAAVAVGKFQDPEISIQPVPSGALSPVSGTVSTITRHGDRLRIFIRVAAFAPYLLRSPVEGKVLESKRGHRGHGLSLRTEAGEDVYMRLYGPRWLAPVSWLDYGNRIGQGQRCGLLRLARGVELELPAASTLEVGEGDRTEAGETLLALLRPRREERRH